MLSYVVRSSLVPSVSTQLRITVDVAIGRENGRQGSHQHAEGTRRFLDKTRCCKQTNVFYRRVSIVDWRTFVSIDRGCHKAITRKDQGLETCPSRRRRDRSRRMVQSNPIDLSAARPVSERPPLYEMGPHTQGYLGCKLVQTRLPG